MMKSQKTARTVKKKKKKSIRPNPDAPEPLPQGTVGDLWASLRPPNLTIPSLSNGHSKGSNRTIISSRVSDEESPRITGTMSPFASPLKLAKSLTKIPCGQKKMGAISLFPINTFTGGVNKMNSTLTISVSKPESPENFGDPKSKGSRAKPRSIFTFANMFDPTVKKRDKKVKK
jgi:hypothetical protein